MFKLFKKQNNDKTKKDTKEKGDACPMCKVSPEVINELKKESNHQEKDNHDCCK